MKLTEKRHVKAIRDLEKAERDMVRAFNRWANLRVTVRRYDARADRAQAGRLANGGEYDQFESIEAQQLVRGPDRRDYSQRGFERHAQRARRPTGKKGVTP